MRIRAGDNQWCRCLPNLWNFDVTKLKRDHLAVRLSMLVPREIRFSRLRDVLWYPNFSERDEGRLPNNIEKYEQKKNIAYLYIFHSARFRFSFGPETTNVWQSHEIRERISLDAHCPVVPLESELVTMGSDLGSIVL